MRKKSRNLSQYMKKNKSKSYKRKLPYKRKSYKSKRKSYKRKSYKSKRKSYKRKSYKSKRKSYKSKRKSYKSKRKSYKKRYSNKDGMGRKSKDEHIDRPLKCDVEGCTFSAYKMYKLNEHKRTHGEKKYKCYYPGCNYGAHEERNLLIHIRKHTGETPFKCKNCHYAARTKSTLKKHQLTHEGKNYKCDYPECDFTTFRKDSLREHKLRMHTPKMPFICKEEIVNDDFSTRVCNYKTSNKEDYEDHLLNVHFII